MYVLKKTKKHKSVIIYQLEWIRIDILLKELKNT